MAKGHSVSADGRVWTVELREGLTWHDGQPVLARDCIASLQRWAKRDAFGQLLDAMADTWEALDDKRFRVTFRSAFPLFIEALANPAMRERVEIALGKGQATQLQAALTVEQALLPLQAAVKGNSTTIQQMVGLAGAWGRWRRSRLHAGPRYRQHRCGRIAGAALRRGNTKIQEGLATQIGKMLASNDLKLIQRATQAAAKSPVVMRFIQDFADEAVKLGGLSTAPLEVTIRPGSGAQYLPAAAGQDQR
ncbi:ABC transporter substrate-binding protein [Boseaceae bacterium BT-24-1]|nr:ABC transporter substrate-binding protein [Boseaceae bacterium BT-24-1]